MPKRKTGGASEAIALTKAIVSSADRLGLSQRDLASIIGLSEPTISRMQKGTFLLEPENGKAFELAQLLLHLYDELDRIAAGDEATMRAWMASDNSALGGRPIGLIRTIRGLVDVVGYLRARSSI